MTAAVVGLVTVGVRMRTARPSCFICASVVAISMSTSAHVARCPAFVGYARRWLSYNPRIDA
jgi:hypothetical protein